MTPRSGLPRLARALLRWTLPEERRDEVLADLEQTLDARRARGRPGGTWREVAALLVWRLRTHAAPRQGRERRTMMGRDFLQDVRFGVRTLARRPAFAIAAVLVLGLGVGAPTTVLTLVERIFFERPAHVAEPDRLVRLWRTSGEGGSGTFQHPDYLHYRDGATTLAGLAAWGGQATVSFAREEGRPDQLRATFVSGNWFDVLGTRPHRGRFFRPEENDRRGEDAVIVLSHGFWQRALGGDERVVGSSLSLDGRSFTVVGVAPRGFRGLDAVGDEVDAWIPLAMYGEVTGARSRAWWERVPGNRSRWLNVVGRVAPGYTIEAAEGNLQAVTTSLTSEGRDEGEGLLVSRQALYRPDQHAALEDLFRMLLAVVLAVALIATANVAVLLLSRATTRAREIGVRTALGAARGRVVRQLLAESLVLGAAGGALGVLLAFSLSDAAAALLPFPFPGGFAPDLRVLGAALVLAVGTSVLAGLAPALAASRTDPAAALEDARVIAGAGRVRGALVVGQVALSMMLVAGALLFARSFWTAQGENLGFATEDRLVLTVDLRAAGYEQDEARVFLGAAVERLKALPGVHAAAAARMVPFDGEWSTEVEPPVGAVGDLKNGSVLVGLNAVTPGWFELMEMPILQGRALGPEDHAGAPLAVVVNETLAARLWPGGEPVGQQLPRGPDRMMTVVGVARDATYYELGEEPRTQMWSSLDQVYQPYVSFIVHTKGEAGTYAAAVQEALRQMQPRLAFQNVTSLEASFERVTARYRVTAALVGVFGALALALAAAGLYAVVSFGVAQRRREIGVRMALGAARARVARDVLRSGLSLTGAGLALGLVGAVALRRFTAAFLYGVAPEDPAVLAGAAFVLMAVAMLAAAAPASRATRVDPAEALRAE